MAFVDILSSSLLRDSTVLFVFGTILCKISSHFLGIFFFCLSVRIIIAFVFTPF